MAITLTVQAPGCNLTASAGTVAQACYALFVAYVEAGYGHRYTRHSDFATLEDWVAHCGGTLTVTCA